MAAWQHMQTPEYQEELLRKVLNQTHADIPPPWED